MQTVHFDLSTKSDIPFLHVKQGDVGRRFRAVVTDGGAAYTIPAGAQFSVWFSGPGGEGNYSAIGDRSAFTVEGNTVTVELIAQMLVNSGTGAMCLVLSADDGTQLGLWNVVYAVEHIPGMGSKAAEGYYTALSELARQAIDAAATFETDASLSMPGKSADASVVGEKLAGKAPAGFGLGEVNGKWCEDPNTAVTIGFYRLGGTATVNVPDKWGYGTMIVERRSGCIYQTVKNADGFTQLQMIVRCSEDSGATWSEWEYVNPPMYVGVEYRTTERHNGKAVYAKAIDFGALPNNSEKQVEFCAEGATAVCDLKLHLSDGYMLSSGYGIDKAAQVSYGLNLGNTRTKVRVYAEGNYSNLTAYATIKYTKD